MLLTHHWKHCQQYQWLTALLEAPVEECMLELPEAGWLWCMISSTIIIGSVQLLC
jgi:hypothetical protein